MHQNQYLVCAGSALRSAADTVRYQAMGLSFLAGEGLAFSHAVSGNQSVVVLGEIIDPFAPDATNSDVVRALAESSTGIDAFITGLRGLGGRFVAFFQDAESTWIMGDACCLRQIYYGRIAGESFVTSSPRLFYQVFGTDIRQSPTKASMVASENFKASEGAWYGTETLDDRLTKLLPNHVLDLRTNRSTRIDLSPDTSLATERDVARYAANVLTNTIRAMSKRYSLIQPLTAGWDSRVLLAASRPISSNIHYYTFKFAESNPANDSDVRIASTIAKDLGIDFAVVSPPPLEADFIEKYCAEQIYPKLDAKAENIQYHYHHSRPLGQVNVNGNAAEVARCFYGSSRKAPTIDMLMDFTGYDRHDRFVASQIEQWIQKATPCSEKYRIPLQDLFYWEQRMGNWGALFPFEQDIAIEELSPFNNRALLLALLRIPARRRNAPDYPFFGTLCAEMWPETMQQPVNPHSSRLASILKRHTYLRYYMNPVRKSLRDARNWVQRH